MDGQTQYGAWPVRYPTIRTKKKDTTFVVSFFLCSYCEMNHVFTAMVILVM